MMLCPGAYFGREIGSHCASVLADRKDKSAMCPPRLYQRDRSTGELRLGVESCSQRLRLEKDGGQRRLHELAEPCQPQALAILRP
jgi:hypothetical protein